MSRFSSQWLGGAANDTEGLLMIDVDQRQDSIEGSLYLFESGNGSGGIYADFSAKPVGNYFDIVSSTKRLHHFEARVIARSIDEIQAGEDQLKARFSLTNAGAILAMEFPTGTKREFSLLPSSAGLPSTRVAEAEVNDWYSFEAEATKLVEEPQRYIFRGQAEPWRLRTSFHRTQRKDLVRYWEDEVQAVRRSAVADPKQAAEHGDLNHNGAFLVFLQHFGYPTPLLDWTYSPYVAAYFAYSNLVESSNGHVDPSGTVRIFMFDAQMWKEDLGQLTSLCHCKPHLSFLDASAIDNSRAIAQDAIVTMTNVDDIESYVLHREHLNNKQYLRVFDLPKDECKSVLRRLKLMGTSPKSLFPGPEGFLSEFRQKHFGYDA